MKKLVFLSVLGLLLSNVAITNAVSYTSFAPATFTLNIGESFVVKDIINTTITLMSINSAQTQSYPTQEIKTVSIKVANEGGCGAGADPRCLGMPAFESTYNLKVGASIEVLALKITLNSLGSGSNNATFSVAKPDDVVPPPPVVCSPRPACLDANPRCLLPEPVGGWCSNPPPPVVRSPRPACLDANPRCLLPEPVGGWCSNPPPPVVCSPRPACLDANPRCLLPEPVGGWCSNPPAPGDPSTGGGTTVGGGAGVISPGGVIIICPNGVSGKDCSTCSDSSCKPGVLPPPTKETNGTGSVTNPIKPLPPIWTLPQGQDMVSVEEVKADEETPAYFEVKTERKAKLFFIFPVSSEITYSIDSVTGSSRVTSRPWWNFLAW